MQTDINQDLIGQLVATFREKEANLNGQKDSVQHQLRRKGLEAFEKMEFPTTRNEEWKYTNIIPATSQAYSNYESKLADADIDINQYLPEGLRTNVLVFVNGHYRKEASQLQYDGAYTIESIIDCQSEALGSVAKLDDQIFTAMNTASFEGGLHISIADHEVASQAIVILYLNDASQGSLILNPRNLITAGKNSEATIIEFCCSINDTNPVLVNALMEVTVDESANLDIYKIQSEERKNTTHISRIVASQQQKSNFSSNNFTFGGALVRNDLDIELQGEHCESYLNGLYLGSENQLIDNHSFVDHASPNCMSDEFYKGIMDDTSRAVFNGKIMVREDAQKTNAFQSNRNILASDTALVNTKPQLEIYADDVRCTHGATIGQINQEAIFYMQARGISKESAKAILMLSFAGEVVDRLKFEDIKPYLQSQIADKRRYEGELILD